MRWFEMYFEKIESSRFADELNMSSRTSPKSGTEQKRTKQWLKKKSHGPSPGLFQRVLWKRKYWEVLHVAMWYPQRSESL